MFTDIALIIAHIERKHAHQVWIGKDYSVKDLCNDLREMEKARETASSEDVEKIVGS